MHRLALILGLLATSMAYGQTKKALFLGNSYTGANNLPNLVYQLALSNGDTLIHDSNTPGGYTYQGHSTNSTTINKINAQDWDYVVLQEQSQRPSFSPAQVANEVYPYAAQLDSMIKANDPCTETVFYMTWGRKNGDASNCVAYPPICTYAGMQDRLRSSYLQMTNTHEAICAPAGSAWWHSITLDPNLNLYTADESHPNINGSYLTACVFYATLWRKSPVGLPYTSTLSSGDAAFLQQVAHTTVFDSLDLWRIGADDVNAGFDWAVGGSGEIIFTDTSANATMWDWDFGDGSGHTAQSPTHTYSAVSPYTVTLIASDGCTSDTATVVVQPIWTDIAEYGFDLQLYPNPAQDALHIASKDLAIKELAIYDLNGKRMRHVELEGDRVNVASLAKGNYILVINKHYSYSFVKQ